MKTALILTKLEVQTQLRYDLIYETTHRSIYKTGRAHRMLHNMFNEYEIKEINDKIIPKANKWYLKGIPDGTTITTREFNLWKLFERYCSLL